MKFLSFFLLFTFVGINLYFSQLTFLDIPYRDSWQLISAAMSENFPISWIFTPHNEHIISSTKLLVVILNNLNSWNVNVHLYLNYFLYLLSLGLLYFLIKENVDKKMHPILVLSFIFFFSDANWENLTWEFQSSFHFCVLFSLITIYFLHKKDLSILNVFLACAFNFLSVFSLSSSVVSSFCVLICFLLLQRKAYFYSKLVIALSFIATNLLWYFFVNDYLSNSSQKIFPDNVLFWDFFLNLSSFGFGFEQYSFILGLVCLSPMLIALCLDKDKNPVLISILVFTLSTIATIAIGRAAETPISIWSKGGRYFQIAVILVPLNAALCLKFFKNDYIKVICALILPLIGFSDNFKFQNFVFIASQKDKGIQCIEKIESKELLLEQCNQIWGEPIKDKLLISKRLGLSFTKNLKLQKN